MERYDAFGTYHPIINFIYFAAVISFGIIFIHPLLLLFSAAGAFSYAIYLQGRRALRLLLPLIPMIFAVVLINAAFNHRGMTLLFYIGSNSVTLESVLYGFAEGFMVVGVIMWFSCCSCVMTSDKFVYLFGRILPVLSLIFSMSLRMVPHFAEQLKKTAQAQSCIGSREKASLIGKVKQGLRITSIVTTWALENAIDTADSMKARGYGLPGRTSFSLYRFDKRDLGMSIALAALSGITICGAACGKMRLQFYPFIQAEPFDGISLTVYAAYFILCLLPLAINLSENIKWKRLQSKI